MPHFIGQNLRYPSLSSFPSDLNVDDTSFQTPLPVPSSPNSSISPDSKPAIISDLLQLQHRNWMLESDDAWVEPAGLNFNIASTDDQFPSTTTAHNDFSQAYGNTGFPEHFFNQLDQQPDYHYPVSSHRRFPSTSTVASAAESPYANNTPLPIQQYPTTYTQPAGFQQPQSYGWSYDPTAAISGIQHLPTPIGTPTSDKFGGINPRRSRPASRQQTARQAAAFNSVRLALNEQWKPSTYTQAHPQIPSISVTDMPRTPQGLHREPSETQQYGAGKQYSSSSITNIGLLKPTVTAASSVPGLFRTESDVRADVGINVYGPVQTPSSRRDYTQSQQQPPIELQQRLQAANEARSSSPSSSNTSPHQNPWQTKPLLRKQASEELTISPKDAFLEDPDIKEDDPMPSLFPQSSSEGLQYGPHDAPSSSFTSMPPQSNFSYTASSLPTNGQSYGFTSYNGLTQGQQYGNYNSYVPNLTTMETTKSEESSGSMEPDDDEDESDYGTADRPSDTSANSGRYTCPYRDSETHCTARFHKQEDLIAHKKKAHRTSGPGIDKRATAMTQSGEHWCTRTDERTGKPCNTKFSRPYDLTRHEETIHSTSKKKIPCSDRDCIKRFSRPDALTRHERVVHGLNTNHTGKTRGRR